MKKTLKLILTTVLCLALLTAAGCSTNSSIVFDVETGDSIEVTLDTSDSNGYKLTQSDGVFAVSTESDNVLQGTFLNEEMYDAYIDVVSTNPDVTILKDASEEANPYIFYTVTSDAGEEYNYILWINGTSTGVIMGGLITQETATQTLSEDTIQSVFSLLSFEAA